MVQRIPGAFGQPGRAVESVRDGTGGVFQNFSPASIGTAVDSWVGEIGALLESGARWVDIQPLAVRYLGSTSFSAGAAYGVGLDVVHSVIEITDLLKVLVLADLYDAAHGPMGGWQISPLKMLIGRAVGLQLGDKLKEAHDQREELIKALGYAIANPGEFFGNIKEEYVEKWRRFETLMKEQSLSARFEAGRIFGELLLAVALLIGTGAGLVKLCSKFPKLLRLRPALEKAAAGLRRQGGAAAGGGSSTRAVSPSQAAGRPRAKAVEPESQPKAKPKEAAPPRPRVIRELSRDDYANWLRKEHNITSEAKLQDMMAAMDPSKPIRLVELPAGTPVQQYVRTGGAPGSFFAYPGTPAAELAIQNEGRTLVQFTLKETVQVVEGTAAPFPVGKYPGVGGVGGGTQLVFPLDKISAAVPK